MKVLLIKTSSLGDVIHTLPALTDAAQQYPDICFDWLVEESFSDVPSWHPAVRQVLPVAIRRWRKAPIKSWQSPALKALRRQLATTEYDAIIDAQGLLKSVWLSRLNPAYSVGYDWGSAREPLVSLFYDQRVRVQREQHAVERTRQLFAKALSYDVSGEPDYGLSLDEKPAYSSPYVFLLHGTTWFTKHLPEPAWLELVSALKEQGLLPVVTWGNEAEKARAQRLAQAGAEVLPKTDLASLALALKGAAGAISVDTGLGHLAAALNVPLVGLYGPTDPSRSGIYGPRQLSLSANYHCAPCMKRRCRFEVLGANEQGPGGRGSEPPCWSGIAMNDVISALMGLVSPR